MSTNFVQVNPSAANQETDAAFASDSLTTGGVGVDATLPSKWLNKVWYQSSTFIAALAQALSAKGYNLSDANLSTLAGVLGNIITNADLKAGIATVTYSATPVFDGTSTNGFFINLGGNVTSSTLVNVSPGQLLTFVIRTNGNSFAWPATCNLAVPVSGNTTAVQQFIVLPDGSVWSVTGLLQGIVGGLQTSVAALTSEVAGLTPIQPRTAYGGGFYRISADGTIEVWGTVTLPATHTNQSSVNLPFACPNNTFTGNPVVMLTVASRARAANADAPTLSAQNTGINGATVFATTVVPEGGGGVTFDQAVTVNYYAIGN